MFVCVKTHNFDVLSKICDDDFGIIDINPTGGSEIMRYRAGWENWFTGLFAQLDKMEAQTWSVITHYEELLSDKMAYSVVDFDQLLINGDEKLKFGIIATIIWKKIRRKLVGAPLPQLFKRCIKNRVTLYSIHNYCDGSCKTSNLSCSNGSP
jgi:hypothetical protein